MYFSEAALNRVDDARHTTSSGTSTGLTAKLLTLTHQKTVTIDQPGSADRVDYALKKARKAGRRVQENLHEVTSSGALFDIEVSDLHVGVLPFLYFGEYGERSPLGPVRVFWAQAIVPASRRQSAAASRELILLGSLNRLVDEPWSDEDKSALKIGHDYPSDPSVLSRLVGAELQLEDAAVKSHIDSVENFEILEPGCYAEFASQQTARARKTMIRDRGYITRWERQFPLRRARVVAITHDICDSSEETSAGSALLARPILIRDLS